MPAAVPTKSRLIAAKRTLALANTGYELMDKKRNILIAEILALLDSAAKVQEQIESTFREAYSFLQSAHIMLGVCEEIARGMPVDDTLTVRLRSVMGMELPVVSLGESEPENEYGFERTNSMLDEAYLKFVQAKRYVCRLAEIETGVYRLAAGIKTAQKRANALKNVIIPDLEREIARIAEAIEDKDREDFVRLKCIKRYKKA